MNQVSTVGAMVLGFSVLLFVVNVFYSLRKGELSGPDPWDGATLEWSIPSPPPAYNFAEVPVVHSRDAFWARKYPDRVHESAALPAHSQASRVASSGTGAPTVIHMPAPSFYPFLAAMGLLIAASGLLFTMLLVPIGILVVVAGVFGWSFEPA